MTLTNPNQRTKNLIAGAVAMLLAIVLVPSISAAPPILQPTPFTGDADADAGCREDFEDEGEWMGWMSARAWVAGPADALGTYSSTAEAAWSKPDSGIVYNHPSDPDEGSWLQSKNGAESHVGGDNAFQVAKGDMLAARASSEAHSLLPNVAPYYSPPAYEMGVCENKEAVDLKDECVETLPAPDSYKSLVAWMLAVQACMDLGKKAE